MGVMLKRPNILPFFRHDSRNEIEQIHEQKQGGEYPREFLKLLEKFLAIVFRMVLTAARYTT